ncbi:hypothetical protein [Desulfofundulus thermosubterraneus]|uniref:hypothetical protein n=1 Tax=Desulfofundulus thermosubterraneus TaxID=348840 RepID=UPI001041D987|nr:hypothetical protein [Desulfofundulus thermosubterraneus]
MRAVRVECIEKVEVHKSKQCVRILQPGGEGEVGAGDVRRQGQGCFQAAPGQARSRVVVLLC